MSEVWPELYERFDDLCGFTNALSETLTGEQQQICDLISNVDGAITVYLNGPMMILVALVIGGAALMIAVVAPRGEPWQYNCCALRVSSMSSHAHFCPLTTRVVVTDSGTNIGAIFLNVCVGLYLYNQYLNFMQMMCDLATSRSDKSTFCSGYEPPPPPPSSYSPPPPPSSSSGPSAGRVLDNFWDMANDKEGAKVLWVLFTHISLSIFRPVGGFMLCCCKEPPAGAAGAASAAPQQIQMEMQPQMPMQPQPAPAPVANPLAKMSADEFLGSANLMKYQAALVEAGASEVSHYVDLQEVRFLFLMARVH